MNDGQLNPYYTGKEVNRRAGWMMRRNLRKLKNHKFWGDEGTDIDAQSGDIKE